jgi:hypothetical protein
MSATKKNAKTAGVSASASATIPYAAQRYRVELTGQTPLLMHYYNQDWAEAMDKWLSVPENKKISKAGDDRTPAHRWIGNLYFDDGRVCIPSDNLMTMLREGGSKCSAGGKLTYKRQTQSGLVIDQIAWPLLAAKGEVMQSDIEPLTAERSFPNQMSRAEELGFMLFVKPAAIKDGKHTRVRPRFDVWSAAGTITVLDETITHEVLQRILTAAGRACGLCDWRPSSPSSPGSFGKFTVTVEDMGTVG